MGTQLGFSKINTNKLKAIILSKLGLIFESFNYSGLVDSALSLNLHNDIVHAGRSPFTVEETLKWIFPLVIFAT